ncbi:hypothetical protein NDU88_001363 [Pleurodeles waltl]|uniref:Uncharacterized protein n=1 Tax=Pleurodeles waltl TaxID=8319 RepID=A0AAV7SCE7_PLEWA|nr:hypothetical protein NDU88_001363 [Pleurodeles waltl]
MRLEDHTVGTLVREEKHAQRGVTEADRRRKRRLDVSEKDRQAKLRAKGQKKTSLRPFLKLRVERRTRATITTRKTAINEPRGEVSIASARAP